MQEQFEFLFKSILKIILFLSNPIILIPIVIVTIIVIVVRAHYSGVKEYKEGSYYKITNIPYSKIRDDIGKYGEYLIYEYLKSLEKDGAKFLFNIYVPKNDEETTEIDVLMISRKGLFVFESKNYSGWIFGSDNQKYWYQTLPKGRGRSHKESFYNPVFQNNTHIKYLKSLVGDQIPIHSIITFSERCTLMDVKLQSSKVSVINRYQVYELVCSIYNNYPDDSLSDFQINEIYNILYPHTQVDNVIRQKHVDDIRNNIIEKRNNIEETLINENQTEDINTNADVLMAENSVVDFGVCPICGAKLILRKAKYGEHAGEKFYGCSNYPKCKYIGKLDK